MGEIMIEENIDIILRGRKMKKLIEREFIGARKKYGIRQVEIEILMFLKRFPEANASDISRQMLINKGHVSQAVDQLCKLGYLSAQQNKDDRRYVSFRITPLADTVIDECVAVRNEMAKELFAGITSEEIEVLCKISAKLCANIDSITQV